MKTIESVPEWKKQRTLKRDNFKCRHCNSEEDLQVYHTTRLYGEDYDGSVLITLCEKCHNGIKNYIDGIHDILDQILIKDPHLMHDVTLLLNALLNKPEQIDKILNN